MFYEGFLSYVEWYWDNWVLIERGSLLMIVDIDLVTSFYCSLLCDTFYRIHSSLVLFRSISLSAILNDFLSTEVSQYYHGTQSSHLQDTVILVHDHGWRSQLLELQILQALLLTNCKLQSFAQALVTSLVLVSKAWTPSHAEPLMNLFLDTRHGPLDTQTDTVTMWPSWVAWYPVDIDVPIESFILYLITWSVWIQI